MSQTSYLKPFIGFPLALKIRSKLLNMVLQDPSGRGLSLPLYLICWLMVSTSCVSRLGVELEIWNASVSESLVQINIYIRYQAFYYLLFYVL